MSKRKLNVGLVGYQFMGKAHSNAYRQVGRFFDLPVEVGMRTICGRTEGAVKEAADKMGWERYETDWRRLLDDPDIHIVDVATPGSSHKEIACAAAEAGKIVFCEKPIGNTLDEAREMLDAVQKAKVAHAVFHNYRKAPAVALAKKLIEEGKLGTLYHFRAVYLQDWIADPNFPLVWRLQKETAGSGTHGDINAHIIDLARHLVGEFKEVSGCLHTFVKRRPKLAAIDDRLGGTASEEMGDVTVDDAAMFIAKLAPGAGLQASGPGSGTDARSPMPDASILGTFEASRFAVGRKNHNRFEINGSKGSVVFNLERMNELEFYDNTDPSGEHGFRLIQATDGVHPYAGNYWPVGHIIGYEHTFVNLVADALTAIHEGRPCSPDFTDGYENQRVLDAVERSWENRGWVELN